MAGTAGAGQLILFCLLTLLRCQSKNRFKNMYYFLPFNISKNCNVRQFWNTGGRRNAFSEAPAIPVQRWVLTDLYDVSATCYDNLLLCIIYLFNFWKFFKRLSYNQSRVLIAHKGKSWTCSSAKLYLCFCNMLHASCCETSPRLHQCPLVPDFTWNRALPLSSSPQSTGMWGLHGQVGSLCPILALAL